MKPSTIFPVVVVFLAFLSAITSALPITASERHFPGGCRTSSCHEFHTESSVDCTGGTCDLPPKREKRVTLCKMGDCDLPSKPERRSPDNGDECDQGAEGKNTFQQ